MPHNELLAIINLFNYSMKKGGELIGSLRYGLAIWLDVKVFAAGGQDCCAKYQYVYCSFHDLKIE